MRWLGMILMAIGALPLAWCGLGILRGYAALREASLDIDSTAAMEHQVQAAAATTLRWLPISAPFLVLGMLLVLWSLRRNWRRRRSMTS